MTISSRPAASQPTSGRRRGLAASDRRFALIALTALTVMTASISCTSARTGDGPATASSGTVAGAAAAEDAGCGTLGEPGQPAPTGLGAGDLIASTELTPSASGDGFPTGARVWRVLYVSVGVDETSLVSVCGLVAAPAQGPKVVGGRANLLAWAHGTAGLAQRCMPSVHPEKGFWGAMPFGINAIGTGAEGAPTGDAAAGALQFALNQGWVVAATDYEPSDTYVLGRVAAGNVIDSARAAAQLVAGVPGVEAPPRYSMVTWGHSQGGHAALWAGQLADTYQAAARPSKPTPPLTLAGVVALAPASTFVTEAGSSETGLADWEMHKSIEVVGLPVASLELQIGPALFSYIFGSWAQYAASHIPRSDAQLPAFPPAAPALARDAVLTEDGSRSVDQLTPLCLEGDARQVQSLVAPYRDASAHQFLVPPLWNLPSPYSPGQYFPGGLSATCAQPSDREMAAWCDWIRWNQPGPSGVNPYPKLPSADGEPVPVLIGQGMDDTVIHCQPAAGSADASVPGVNNCMSSALFRSLSSAYCPAATSPQGTLTMLAVRKVPELSPASHLSIPGQLSTAGGVRVTHGSTFAGSPVEQFISGAFAGSLPLGCDQRVVNP